MHFVFEWANYWRPVAVIAPVNESVWEHFKMCFWPGLFFAVAEYFFLKQLAINFWTGKALGLLLMPLVIGLGFYGYTALTGKHYLAADIVLFLIAVVAGQLASYKIMVMQKVKIWLKIGALLIVFLLTSEFVYFSFAPPKIFLFEDSRTQNYGIPGDLNIPVGER